ncbi:LOW QUALITY PROTEIN: apolipoprotein L3-like [Brachyistius frenatus]|uniref:LOW QUALITY PROTEIN: apolipoprotein L3-like n=1 Tax=Brachyistius frenatus TaxID=100188 RepID=UPI0037E80021
MSTARKELQEALSRYASDTLTDIRTAAGFCETFPKWILRRENELEMMVDIKTRADNISQAENKGKAFMVYLKSKVMPGTVARQQEELEKELAIVLKETLGGLESLDLFLEAVEKLAVTSLHVFTENRVLRLPEKFDLEQVEVPIAAAQLVCPLLLEFKRDDHVFFLPRLQNAEVLAYQLDRYIQSVQTVCEKMEKSRFSNVCPKTSEETVVELDADWTDDEVRRMLDHINQLHEIRSNQDFRTVFLFQEVSCSRFVSEFNERQPRMLQFLNALEENAVQLDRMNKGSKISSVTGSSVGAVGGVLSIVGLALMPFTAGASGILLMTGIGMGVTSGVNGIVTAATEVGVNFHQQKKAGESFHSFMEDVQSLQDELEKVTSQPASRMEPSEMEVALGVSNVLYRAGCVVKSIDALVDLASAGKVVAQEGKALSNVPRVAAEIPDIGQAAAKSALITTKAARAGFIALNALFLGMDIFFICKDSISLASGNQTEFSQFIRCRAELWRSEMDSWQKMCKSLQEGLPRSEKNKHSWRRLFIWKMET